MRQPQFKYIITLTTYDHSTYILLTHCIGNIKYTTQNMFRVKRHFKVISERAVNLTNVYKYLPRLGNMAETHLKNVKS